MMYTITKNPQFNSIEVLFDGKPSEAIRSALKDLRFRWHGQKKVWYGYASEEAVRAAIEGKPEAKAESKTATKATKKRSRAKQTKQYSLRTFSPDVWRRDR